MSANIYLTLNPFKTLCTGLPGEKGDVGFPGIGLPGWAGQKVNFSQFLKLFKPHILYNEKKNTYILINLVINKCIYMAG